MVTSFIGLDFTCTGSFGNLKYKNSPTCLFWLQVVVAPTCPVCLVLEVDNLSQELPFALDWSGLTRAYGNFPKLMRDNAGKIKGKTLATNVLRELTQSQLIGLVGAYSEDLILGGYNNPLVS